MATSCEVPHDERNPVRSGGEGQHRRHHRCGQGWRKRGPGFRKHHRSRATAGRSQAYQWMEPLTKSPVSAIATIRARTPTTARAAFER
jgi:hypothetical protein